MKKINLNVAMLTSLFISTSVFAAAPVNDITINGVAGNNVVATRSNTQIEEQLEELTRLLNTRNKMQVRLQSQLDVLSHEMRQIKGSIELFEHKMEQVENRQRNLYQLLEEQSNPSGEAVVDSTSVPGDASEDKVAYQKAVDLVLVNKEYEQAIVAFEAFVIDYPQSNYLANSYYWLGQLLYKEQKRTEARAAFLTVADKYNDSNKRPDALFKIGIIDEYLGNLDSAKIFYNKVLKEFPDSSAAGLSQKRLASF